MKKSIIQLPEINLVGIKAENKTSNKAEMGEGAQISKTINKYFESNIPALINERSKPGTSYCVYTEYENDFNGDYTYFIGEEVTTLQNLSEDLTSIIIPAQKYVKFTSENGKMPEVCINMWMEIWQMTPETLGGTRTYIADFEVYDERALDPENTILDIYIGIK